MADNTNTTPEENAEFDVRTKIAVHDEKFNSVMAKIDMLVGEMRQQNEMRANEISALSASTDSKMAEIRASIDGMNKHVRNLTYTSIAAIAAMVITVLLNLPK